MTSLHTSIHYLDSNGYFPATPPAVPEYRTNGIKWNRCPDSQPVNSAETLKMKLKALTPLSIGHCGPHNVYISQTTVVESSMMTLLEPGYQVSR